MLAEQAFVLRFFGEAGDRLLLINLGPDLVLDIAPEPLLAPPQNRLWATLWTSEDIEYGGCGTPRPTGRITGASPPNPLSSCDPDGVNPWD